MTLAIILVSFFLTIPGGQSSAAPPSQEPAQPPSAKPAATSIVEDQGKPEEQKPPSESKTVTPTHGSAQHTPGKPKRHKKKVVPANCPPAPAAGSDPHSASAPSGSESANRTGTESATPGNNGTAANTPSPAATANTPCPPSKTIVRHGGTSEPHIELVGGPNDKANQQRDNINRMLAVTDQNLKKMAGRTLAANQQDMVNQSRQFTQQARTALAAQDFDRARTLAWKAQLLSEELVNPKK